MRFRRSIILPALSLIWLGAGSRAASAESSATDWRECQRADLGGVTVPFHSDGSFLAECAPDTLYSWQLDQRLQGLIQGGDSLVPLSFRFLYAWRTPIQTSNYGNNLIRIKLKPGVKFMLIDESVQSRECSSDEANVIHVGYKVSLVDSYPVGFSEYILCSPDVVESWSYGTREALAEAKRESALIKRSKRPDIDTFRLRGKSTHVWLKNVNVFFEERRLPELEASLLLSEGKIFYAPGVRPDPKAHFSTKTPSAINPHAEASLYGTASELVKLQTILGTSAAPCTP